MCPNKCSYHSRYCIFYPLGFLSCFLSIVLCEFGLTGKREKREGPIENSNTEKVPLWNFLVGRMVVVPVKIMTHKNLFLIFHTYVLNVDLCKFSLPHIKLNESWKALDLLLFLKN